jgi:FkbH-like protein
MDNLKYLNILQLNKVMFEEVKGTPYRVTVLSNVIVNSIKELLEYILHINQINPFVELGNYDNVLQDSAKCTDSNLVIIFYNTHNIVSSMSSFIEDIPDESYNNIKERVCSEIDIIFDNLKNSPSVIFNLFSTEDFEKSFLLKSKIELLIFELNEYLNKKKPINVTLVDIDKVISHIGIKQAFDARLYHSSKVPYTLAFLKNYVSAIEPIILRNTGKLKKAILFDCDNTLWKGILGEDGPDKIDMSVTSHDGSIYNTIQRIAVFLSKHGVIVGLCSKNNELDILEVITKHPDIILKNDFITISKINWEDKATNLRSIASELNIGLDTIVFVDDSTFEINLIKEQIPEILTLQVPSAIYEYPNFLLKNVYKYFNFSETSEGGKKAEIYKQQFIRENLKKEYATLDDYLSSLNISLSIFIDDQALIPRIAELTQKTNQFNLTTKRYTENQILNFMKNNEDHVFVISVKDKFGDNGLTGVCIIRKDSKNKNEAIIDTFLMSCRIIGRNIEFAIMDFIVQWLTNNLYTTCIAEFTQTKKNIQVECFYDEIGFNLISNNEGSKHYSLKLSDYIKRKSDYINIETKL